MAYANWRSMDAAAALRGVRQDMSRRELLEIAYNARVGAARRVALVYLNDPELLRSFALEDPDPMVRRGLARRLTDADALRRLMDDEDETVRAAAATTLAMLRTV